MSAAGSAPGAPGGAPGASPSTVHLTREALYDLVWSEPMRVLAERFAISDVGLAKTCKRLNVPVPGLGYWRRKETGHTVRRTPLPHLPPHVRLDREVTLTRRVAVAVTTDPSGAVTGIAADGPGTGCPVSRTAAQAAYEAAAATDPTRRIRVADSLDAAAPLHPLVERTAAALGRAEPDAQGLLTPAVPALAVTVTPAGADRALRILDALLKALEARGYRVTDDPPPPRRPSHEPGPPPRPAAAAPLRPCLRVLTGESPEDAVEVTLAERVDVAPPPTPAPTSAPAAGGAHRVPYIGTGALVLTLPNAETWMAAFLAADAGGVIRRSWADGARQRLERVLPAVVVALVAAGEARTRWRLGLERRERERREAEERRAETQRRREQEAARVQELERQLAAAAKVAEIRAYVAAVRAAAAPPGAVPDAVDDWLAWAEAYADRLDPVRRLLSPNVPFTPPGGAVVGPNAAKAVGPTPP